MTILIDDGFGNEVLDEVQRLQAQGWSVTSVCETKQGLIVVLRKT